MFGGMTSRGWSSTGKDLFGLQRMVWNGKMPFEMAEIHAMSDGFELTFSKPVDKTTAVNADNYDINSFTYQYHHTYGSPVIQNKTHVIKAIIVSEDLTKVRLVLDESRRYFIHEIKPKGVKSKENEPLLHEFAYYTLNNIPTNAAADLTKNSMVAAMPIAKNMGHANHKMPTTKPLSKKEQRKKAEAERLSMKRQTTMPNDWSAPDKVIAIGTKAVLKFDVEQVEVKAGSKIKLIFSNLDDDMTHNLVIVEPETADEIGNLAIKLGMKGSQLSYVPNNAKVLFHTSLVQPSTSETIYFVAPTKAGNYTYVCTYPGHHTVMQGILKVVE
jgi:azurin